MFIPAGSPMRLLERLRRGPHPAIARSHDAVLRQSILDHLLRLLNTRRGHAPIDPELGLPASIACDGAAAARVAADIARVITRYEPRLREVRVTPRDTRAGHHGPSFAISGRVGCDLGRVLEATSRVTASGRFILDVPGT